MSQLSSTLKAAGSKLKKSKQVHNYTKRELWSRRFPLLPALLFVFALTQFPFLLTIYFSFQKWILLRPDLNGFAWFDNYKAAFTDPEFLSSIGVTVVITSLSVILALVIGLLLAVLLDRKFIGRSIARTMLITPILIMPTAASLMWKTIIFDPNTGVMNWFIMALGGSGVDWTADAPLWEVVIAIVWQWTPFMMLILLAGLQAQSPEIIEAARVDGAGAFSIFRHMTLPHLRQFIELAVILGTIYIYQTFDQVYMITAGGPGIATATIPFYLYRATFQYGNIGMAGATGVVVVVATIILSTFALRLMASAFKQEVQVH